MSSDGARRTIGGGYFLIARSFLDHPMFKPSGPYSRSEAGLWLIREAAYAPREITVASGTQRQTVHLNRGQLTHSIRHLATTWRWSPNRVQRFLHDLARDGFLTTQTDTAQTIITICNYNKYQMPYSGMNTAADTQANTAADTNKKEIEITKVADEGDGGSSTAEVVKPLVSREARDLADELLVIAGHQVEFVPPGWCGAAMRVQAWLSSGWSAEVIKIAVTAAAARKRGPPANSVQFFENAIAEEVARQAAPVPVVTHSRSETVYARRTQAHRPSLVGALDASLAAARERERQQTTIFGALDATIAALRSAEQGDDAPSGREREKPLRLLPNG